MPKPRYAQVSLEATPYYHCYSRYVRRGFLCGLDTDTGVSYEHRKQWLEKLNELQGCIYGDFSIVGILSFLSISIVIITLFNFRP